MTQAKVSRVSLNRLADAASRLHQAMGDAEYHGREVPLNKPMPGDVKKSKVFVKDPQTGNVKKVNFGDPDMKIKKNSDAHRESYCARSAGQGNTDDKTSPNYWSRKAWNCK